ncbi:peptidase S8, partial [Catellatospora citrea]
MFSLSRSSAFRRGRWQLLSAVTTVPLLAAGFVVLQSPVQAAQHRPTPPAKPSATHKVTLVTGDVVTVTTMADGNQAVDVDRPDQAVGGVKMHEIKGDLYVVPDEAVSLLAADKLDRRLFNVTDLIEMGYDDAKSSGVPLIATYTAAQARAVVEPKAPRGSRLTRKLKGIRGAALTADKKQTRSFWTTVAPQGSTTVQPGAAAAGSTTLGEGVAKLWLDGRVEVNLKESVPL